MPDKITNCRGDKQKQDICDNYDVKVISRMALLPGKTIEGCCGDLENEHTVFYYKHKISNDEGTFSVGKDCAQSFLGILKQKLPELVNPLTSPPSLGGGPSSTSGSTSITIPKINDELYTAINLWCILKGQIPKFALQKILTDIQANPLSPVPEKSVFEFLKVMSTYKKTLKELLDEARRINPNIKNYNFPTINNIASKNWIDLP